MYLRDRRNERRGLTNFELLVVVATIAVLLMVGFVGYCHARRQARVCLAQTRLKQIGTGLDLYFNQYGSYPPQGADLAEALSEFIDADTCENALGGETTPAEAVSLLYRQPSAQALDRPNQYLTAMASEDGEVAVVLLTGGKVVCRWDLDTRAGNYDEILASLLAETTTDDSTDPAGIKYICVKGTDGIVYQSTYKRLGKERGGRAAKDRFVMKVTHSDGSPVTLAELRPSNVKVDVHAGNKKTFSLPTGTTYEELREEPRPLVDPDDESESGWTVQFSEVGGQAQVTVQLNMDLHANEEKLHALTRIWVDFPDFDISVPESSVDGNKFFATRTYDK